MSGQFLYFCQKGGEGSDKIGASKRGRGLPISADKKSSLCNFNYIVKEIRLLQYCNNNIEVDGEVKGKQRPGWMGNLKRTPPFS